MGNVDYLEGRVKLPAAQLATVKRTYRNRQNALVEKAYDELKRFRTKNLTSSVPRWQAAIALADDPQSKGFTQALHIAMKVARSLERPRAVKWEDFTLKYYSRASVQETTFPLLNGEGDPVGEVVFTERVMAWRLFPTKHAVSDFDDTADAAFLYATLSATAWTRGSGGGETYHCEGASPEVRQRFGPAGVRYTVGA